MAGQRRQNNGNNFCRRLFVAMVFIVWPAIPGSAWGRPRISTTSPQE
jgi:hypothetical protein